MNLNYDDVGKIDDPRSSTEYKAYEDAEDEFSNSKDLVHDIELRQYPAPSKSNNVQRFEDKVTY